MLIHLAGAGAEYAEGASRENGVGRGTVVKMHQSFTVPPARALCGWGLKAGRVVMAPHDHPDRCEECFQSKDRTRFAHLLPVMVGA